MINLSKEGIYMFKNQFLVTLSLMTLIGAISATSVFAAPGDDPVYHAGLVSGSSCVVDADFGVNHTGNTTTITTTPQQYLNSNIQWNTLNIGQNEILNFNFAGMNQTLLNTVTTGLTTIAGQIKDSGIGASTSRIIIANPNGIMLDSTGYINTNSIVLSSMDHNFLGIRYAYGAKNYDELFVCMQNKVGGIYPKYNSKNGIILNGKIDTNNDVVVVSKGIFINDAKITAGSNINLVSTDSVNFAYNGKITMQDNDGVGRLTTSNEGPLSLNSWRFYDNSVEAEAKDASRVVYAGGIINPYNIYIKSSSLISKDGAIHLTDLRNNSAGINIESSTITAPKGLNLEYSKLFQVKDLESDKDTDIKFIASYKKDSTLSIDGIKKAKSVSTVLTQKELADLALKDANDAYSASLDALIAAKDAKAAKNLKAANEAYADAQAATEAANEACIEAQAASEAAKIESEQTPIDKTNTYSQIPAKVSDPALKANLQSAQKAEADAKEAAQKAADNKILTAQLLKETEEIVNAPKNDVNKMTGRTQSMERIPVTANQNLLAQNIKSFAADERQTSNMDALNKRLFKKTSQGFTILEKITQ